MDMKMKSILIVSTVLLFQILRTNGSLDEISDQDYIEAYEKYLAEENLDSSSKEHSSELSSVNSPLFPEPEPNLGDRESELPSTENESSEQFNPAPFKNTSVDVISETNPCSCVKYFLCDVEKQKPIQNGDVIGLIDIRLGGLTKGSPCDHYFDICCKQIENSKEPNIPEPTFGHSTCGKRNVGGVGFRITGAVDGEAQFGEFPWMAAIVRQEPQDDKPPLNIFLCGGSLIHPKVVLAASHCVFGKNPAELKVRLGEWDTQTPDELYLHQDKFVTKIVIHEDYYAGALYNDVALLFLDEEIKFAPNVDTVCLPPPNLNFDGQRCFASGWGKDTFGQEGKYQVILKKVDIPIVPRGKCQSALRKTRLGPYFRLHDSFVCAGGEPGRDTCRGDGGSPLVCKLPDSDIYVQYGIVAWGIGCGENGIPGVYVNVPKFVPWIEEKLKAANLNMKYSTPT